MYPGVSTFTVHLGIDSACVDSLHITVYFSLFVKWWWGWLYINYLIRIKKVSIL